MAEELQHLIERIQREAVDTGEQQAAKIVTQAREKAATLIKEAEAKATALVEKADKDAQQFNIRSEQALAQSARDLLITVGRGVEKIFDRLIVGSLDKSMDADSLPPILAKVMESYIKEGGNVQSLEILMSAEDKAALTEFFKQRFREELEKGLKINVDARTGKGFKVRLHDRHIEHDFSRDAIAEAVAVYLRPVLAETVYKVSREQA